MFTRVFPWTPQGKYGQRQQLAKGPARSKQWMRDIKDEGRLGWKYNDVRISLHFTNKTDGREDLICHSQKGDHSLHSFSLSELVGSVRQHWILPSWEGLNSRRPKHLPLWMTRNFVINTRSNNLHWNCAVVVLRGWLAWILGHCLPASQGDSQKAIKSVWLCWHFTTCSPSPLISVKVHLSLGCWGEREEKKIRP